MIGLIIIAAFVAYLALTCGVVWWAVRWARKNGRGVKRWAVTVILFMYLLVFWEGYSVAVSLILFFVSRALLIGSVGFQSQTALSNRILISLRVAMMKDQNSWKVSESLA